MAFAATFDPGNKIWTLDASTGAGSNTTIDTNELRLREVRWVTDTTVGHRLTLVDPVTTTRVIFDSQINANNAGDVSDSLRLRCPNGIRVSSVPGGVCYLYLD